jgi:glyoxylate reductase
VSRPRIAVTSDLPGRALEWLEAACETTVHRGPALDTEDAVAAFVGDAEGVLCLLANPVTDAVLAACPRLRVVANCAVGYDNVDLEACRRRGVWVTNTPDVLTEATADLAWALILAVTRRVVEADALVRSGRWTGWALDQMLGTGLQGAQVGIVGFGRIGRAVARRAPAFGLKVAACDPDPAPEPGVDVRFLELDELLATSDVVSLHAPLDEGSRHLLDEARLRRMRPGAVLVNTARGPLVDEAALVRVLADGHLGGAGLDVYEHEPSVTPGLVDRPDVVLLPHIGSATRETRAAMAELAARNLLAVLAGDEPPAPVIRGRSTDRV